MFSVVINERGGKEQRLDFDKPEVSIGRVQGNDVVLAKGNVSKRHARIVLEQDKLVVLDLKSTNGTYVNGRKITSPVVVSGNDKLYIGDFILRVEPQAGADAQPADSAKNARPMPPPLKRKGRPTEQDPHPRAEVDDEAAAEDSLLAANRSEANTGAAMISSEEVRRKPVRAPRPRESVAARNKRVTPDVQSLNPIDLRKEIHDRLLGYMDLSHIDIDRLADEELWEKAEAAIADIVDAMDSEGHLPSGVDQEELIREVLGEALGLGPLEELISDETVDEVMVNRMDKIYVDRRGNVEATALFFSSEKALRGVIERMLATIGQSVDEGPIIDARLRDGSRISIVMPPVAVKGACLAIRKASREVFTMEQLIEKGTLSDAMARFLKLCVSTRRNLLVSGGAKSGKTTLLNALSEYIPDQERVVSIEQVAELQLRHDHWVPLESRAADAEGHGAVHVTELARSALRMRPDRIVVGECYGAEVLDLLQAMNSGQDGSLAALHASSAADALARFESMARSSESAPSAEWVRRQIGNALGITLHQTRFPDGTHRIVEISAVVTGKSGNVRTQNIFVFKDDNSDDAKGRFVATGYVPKFCEALKKAGELEDLSLFDG